MRSRDFHQRDRFAFAKSSLGGLIPLFTILAFFALVPDAVAQPPSPLQANSSSTPPGPHAVTQSIKEFELKQQYVGKTFYLRGGYIDNSLQFDESGRLVSDSPRTSYTLSLVEIDKVSLSKHKLQMEGVRYGLHFLGAGPTDDPVQASDKVRITPKKKLVKITINRATVVASKKKEKQPGKSDTAIEPSAKATAADAGSLARETSGAAALQVEAAPHATRPEPVVSEGPTTQAHANQLLRSALDGIFSQGLDEKLVASLPDFWRLYYQAAAAKSDYKPRDPSIFRQNAVDQKARLLTIFEPPSNDFAQNAGVAGVAMYHVVVEPDGKPAEIAVARPIGFGLDENAVDSIRQASFQPALKDNKPVPVILDLLVQFHIYSKRTADTSNPAAVKSDAPEPAAPQLPGPYTANQPPAKQQ